MKPSDFLNALVQRALGTLSESRERRMYRLEGDAGPSDLHVEAFYQDESLITAARPNALPPNSDWTGWLVTLVTRLTDDSEARRTGGVTAS